MCLFKVVQLFIYVYVYLCVEYMYTYILFFFFILFYYNSILNTEILFERDTLSHLPPVSAPSL